MRNNPGIQYATFSLMLIGGGASLFALNRLAEPVLNAFQNGTVLRQWVESLGWWAPVGYLAIQVLQIVIAPIPGSLATLVGGYLFGPIWGSFLGLLGVAIGAPIAAALARRFGRPMVERLLPEMLRQRWDRMIRIRSGLAWFILMLIPLGDTWYYFAGLTEIPLLKLAVAAVASRVVSVALFTWLGYGMASGGAYLWLPATLLMVMVMVGWLLRQRLDGYLDRLLIWMQPQE